MTEGIFFTVCAAAQTNVGKAGVSLRGGGVSLRRAQVPRGTGRRLNNGSAAEGAVVGSVAALFAPLQVAIARRNQEGGFDTGHPWHHRLAVSESDGLLDIEYSGEYELWFDDRTTVTILQDLLCLLGSGDVAPTLRSFTHRTEAVLAANGTYSIIIDALFTEERPFPQLYRFVLDQGHGEHGYKILASARNGGDGYYDEAGILADLVAWAPALQELVTPSPPSAEFFQGGAHPLRSLDVDSGFGHANFIRNLTGCSRFTELRGLVFTDDRNRYMDDWNKRTTSFEDYVAFIGSPLATRLESICLREVNLSRDQVRQLLGLRSKGVELTIAK